METFGTLDTETAEAVATAEKSGTATPKVVGKGIYLELIKEKITNVWDKDTIQIIITPAGVDEKGNEVPVALTYRSVSFLSPRRQWHTQLISNRKGTTPISSDEVIEQVKGVLQRQMRYGQKKLQGKPLVVEVSNIDLTDVRAYATPSALIRRIMKARTDAGFPVDVYVA